MVTRQFSLSAWLTGRFLAVPAVLNASFSWQHLRDSVHIFRRRKGLCLSEVQVLARHQTDKARKERHDQWVSE